MLLLFVTLLATVAIFLTVVLIKMSNDRKDRIRRGTKKK